MQNLNWRKPSACGEGGNNCPEVAITPDAVFVRSTLHPESEPTQFTPQEWRDPVDGIVNGELSV